MTTLRFTRTHLFPGARGEAGGPLPSPGDGRDCVAGFADGSEAPGTLCAGTEGLVLALGAHVTARGTRVAPKRWAVEAGREEGGRTPLRILRRLPDIG